MQAIVKSKTTFTCTQYDHVYKIEYDEETKLFTISYGTSQTVTFTSNDYLLFVQIL